MNAVKRLVQPRNAAQRRNTAFVVMVFFMMLIGVSLYKAMQDLLGPNAAASLTVPVH